MTLASHRSNNTQCRQIGIWPMILLDEGFTEADLDDARAKMHQINKEQGWY